MSVMTTFPTRVTIYFSIMVERSWRPWYTHFVNGGWNDGSMTQIYIFCFMVYGETNKSRRSFISGVQEESHYRDMTHDITNEVGVPLYIIYNVTCICKILFWYHNPWSLYYCAARSCRFMLYRMAIFFKLRSSLSSFSLLYIRHRSIEISFWPNAAQNIKMTFFTILL